MNGTPAQPRTSDRVTFVLYLLMLVPAAWPVPILLGMVLHGRSAFYAVIVAFVWGFLAPLLWLMIFPPIYRARRKLALRPRRVLIILMAFALASSLYGCMASFTSCADHDPSLFVPPRARGR